MTSWSRMNSSTSVNFPLSPLALNWRILRLKPFLESALLWLGAGAGAGGEGGGVGGGTASPLADVAGGGSDALLATGGVA